MKRIPDARDSVARRARCRQCGGVALLVDSTPSKDGPKGGQWVHAELPEQVHPAVPEHEVRG